MLEEKFDLKTLEEIGYKLKDLHEWSITQPNDQQGLYDVIDGLCRIANMYNHIMIQSIRDGKVITSNPQGYIQHKLDLAYDISKIGKI